MSNKNPFEIRAEVLQLAKEYMDQQLRINIEFAEKMFEHGKTDIKDIYKMYSTEELMEKAKEFYAFVSTKN